MFSYLHVLGWMGFCWDWDWAWIVFVFLFIGWLWLRLAYRNGWMDGWMVAELAGILYVYIYICRLMTTGRGHDGPDAAGRLSVTWGYIHEFPNFSR